VTTAAHSNPIESIRRCGTPLLAWPRPPIGPHGNLSPIGSWAEMVAEMAATSVEFDAYWLDQAEAGIAHFYRWVSPRSRATVLVVWSGKEVHSVCCRGPGDSPLRPKQLSAIEAQLREGFGRAGFTLLCTVGD
jgi:hypothetical protein